MKLARHLKPLLLPLVLLSASPLAQAAVVAYTPSATVNYAMSIASDDESGTVPWPLLAGLADSDSTASVSAFFNGTPDADGFSATMTMSGTAINSFFSTAGIVPQGSVPFETALYEFTVDTPTEVTLDISGSSFSVNGQINYFEYQYGLYRGIPGNVDNIIISEFFNSGIAADSQTVLLDPATYFVAASLYQNISSPFSFGDPIEASYSHTLNISLEIGPTAVVPLPAAVWLLGTGLISLGGLARRRRASISG